MLSKLSLRNARRQAQDYLVYFVTIVMAAALVYAFNGLVFSKELRTLSVMMDSLPLVIVLSSIIVIAIISWLVQYTTGFMLSRRSREFGTYILIGMENRQVARLFFIENLFVGSIALVLGTVFGNLLFQGLRAVTLALFHAPYTFGFSFSLEATGLTFFYFVLIYLFALFKCRKRIHSMKICELINFDRLNEHEVIKKGKSRRKIFVVSIVFGLIGTVMLLLRNLALGILGSVFIIFFLYGFFISFSSGVPAYFDKCADRKYKGQTLLVFRSLSAKLATMGVVMATISLLFTTTLITEGSGMIFNSMFQSRTEKTTCFDLFIGSTGQNDDRFDDYLAYIKDNIPVRDSYQYQIYQGENMRVTDYIRADADLFTEFDFDTLMKVSDYTALRKMLGFSTISLEKGQYYIHCMDYLGKLMAGYKETLTIAGQMLEPCGVSTENFTQSLWDGNGRGFILVVPDEVAVARPVSHSIYAAMTTKPLLTEHYESLCRMRDDKDSEIQGYDTIFSQADIEAENASMYAIIVFPLYYLALVLSMVSATILTIQQLSETGRYRRQFELLSKLGMERREMKRVLNRQFAIYYTMPAVPPLFIGLPFIAALGNILDPGTLSGPWQLLAIVGVTLGMFFFIYFIYILMAYASMKRNILPV